jgi:PAS domain S-box-containing protein
VSPLKDKAKTIPGSGHSSPRSSPPGSPSFADEQFKDAILTAGMDGLITACNTGLCRYGCGPETLVGTKFVDLFAADDQLVLTRIVIPAAREKGRCEATLRLRTRRSEEIPVHLCLSLLRDASATPVGMVAVVSETATGSSASSNRAAARPAVPSPALARRNIGGTEFLIASPVMHKFMGMVDRVAGHTETVLVVGETGTGKELVARTIHESSYRRHKPLVDINCAALPEHLVESELFGYEKGAFSGADSSKPGLFELADQSTIFLDEIGELQPQIQVKLLRVLDGAPYYRLGGHRKITVDVRVVAATNQDLDLAVKEGRFRKDLFHRLSQFQLRVPPLRERPEDIAALAQHFLTLKAPDKILSTDAMSVLQAHPWPGNIRELRNFVAKLAMSSSGPEIGASEIGAELKAEGTAPAPARLALPQSNLENMEEQMIIQALEQTGGHRTQAAEQLGISRRTLSRKLREYGIDANVGEGQVSLGIISQEQQKFFRAKVSIPVTLRNAQGKETQAQAINLSTGGMGLDSINEPVAFAGMLDVSFLLPDSEVVMHAKGRLVWADVGGRAGLRFVVIDPELFQQLQHWTNQKMKNEGWELPN